MTHSARSHSHDPKRDRNRQREWRARLPEYRRLVEEVAPEMWEDAAARRARSLPKPWVTLVEEMRADVHKAARKSIEEFGDEKATEEEKRGYYWSFKVGCVADMVEHLARTIRDDLGFDEEEETLASMALAYKALTFLEVELQDGGSASPRRDRDELRYRMLNALKALTPLFDDVHLMRLRALQVAESAAEYTHVATEAEIEEGIGRLAEEKGFNADAHREYMQHSKPALDGVLARSWLAEIDDAFQRLDPLVVLEEFADAQAQSSGGRTENGEGRVGPVRALARLAVMCGALGYEQREDEDFDKAVDRARGNLLMSRSRIRRVVQEFPGQCPPAP